jgi:hypothetical protein
MPSPEAASRIVGRLFRADGDHITDLKIPVSTRPVDVVLWHSRVFQYKGTEASGQPVYFEASAYASRTSCGSQFGKLCTTRASGSERVQERHLSGILPRPL